MLKDEIKAAHSDFDHCSRGGGLRPENPPDRHFSQLYFSSAVWRNNRSFEYESDLRSNKHYLSSSENKACKKFRLVGDLNPWPLLHRYRRGHGFKSRTSLNLFFRPYFHYCSSSVYYCEDCFHIQKAYCYVTQRYYCILNCRSSKGVDRLVRLLLLACAFKSSDLAVIKISFNDFPLWCDNKG